jgi:hypothetical protein
MLLRSVGIMMVVLLLIMGFSSSLIDCVVVLLVVRAVAILIWLVLAIRVVVVLIIPLLVVGLSCRPIVAVLILVIVDMLLTLLWPFPGGLSPFTIRQLVPFTSLLFLRSVLGRLVVALDRRLIVLGRL